jgi:hypothetical protein
MSQPIPTRIYRITHYSNVPAILQEGIYCANHAACQTRTYQSIGDTSLIARRNTIAVPVSKGGVLNDYVPFYLGPRSPMLFVINKRDEDAQSEVVYLISTVQTIEQMQLPFAFTDGHAYEAISTFHDDPSHLAALDWLDIYSHQWAVDPIQYPHLRRHKQAEFLVHDHVPVNALLGIAVYNDHIRVLIEGMVKQAGLTIPVRVYRPWYY